MRDPANWWRTVQIDLGSRDGVRENLPVLTADGLVGRVSSVGLTRSQVVLFGDPDCRVSALVENPAHDMGVISAGGPLDTSLVELDLSFRQRQFETRPECRHQRRGRSFPRGIPIGQIVDSQPVEFGLYTEARVKLSANLGALEQVWVLFPMNLLQHHPDSGRRVSRGVRRSGVSLAAPFARRAGGLAAGADGVRGVERGHRDRLAAGRAGRTVV